MIAQPRVDALLAKLERGQGKTHDAFSALTPEQWQQRIYDEPSWNPCNLLAHFVSSEEQLLALAQDVASGGSGAAEEFNIDAFNAKEQNRLLGQSPQALLSALDQARQQTIAWVHTLDEAALDKLGRHPALGEVSLETMIVAIYGHQLLHMRDLGSRLARAGADQAGTAG